MSLAAPRQEKEDKSGTECSVAEVAWFYGTMVDSPVFTSFGVTMTMAMEGKKLLGDSPCPPHWIQMRPPGDGIQQVEGRRRSRCSPRRSPSPWFTRSYSFRHAEVPGTQPGGGEDGYN